MTTDYSTGAFARRIAKASVLAMLTLSPLAAMAADLTPFLGRWDAASPNCSYPDGDGIFVIERSRIRYYEAICDIVSSRSAGIGSAVIIERRCEGEGEVWRDETLLVALEQNMIALYQADGGGFTAGRCAR